jgi:hypothetical protein
MQSYTKMAQENPDKYPARMGQSWTDDEVTKLLTSICNKKSVEDIAKDHQRTEGGIKAQLKKMAYDYHKNDKKTIEEIETLTGLSALIINKTISKHASALNIKTELQSKIVLPEISLSKFDIQNEITSIKTEIAEMKADIKELLSCLKSVYDFVDA